MPKSKLQKGEILRDLAAKVKKAKSVVFAEYNALTVKENEELRNNLKAENSEYYVSKKTLLEIAFKDMGVENLNIRDMAGKIAAIFGYEDEVAPAKIVAKFQKSREDKMIFAGGILENKFISAKEVVALSKLPSKQELYARLVGTMNAPVSGFVNVLAGNIRGFVTVLKAIEEKKA
ncbi:50S ribosomal protein L10 [Candidatus Parcubacteria bacterium]|nr:50S ribosomal protein L10 [Patescibacteria group bacterium]MBU4309436.1 50S ribosomal protein L10 [Patescibacteria group bacterium]MBU4431918.1 50S ribosomal protein L10 [Patescibacteria group bacterium]MBU4577797.1 50S ribosomal protein L10 [Patescibacteria group bacterium]MCG2696790.1 50S ribosomal protein L10 [Candidatus Parcubacteria bacterium]